MTTLCLPQHRFRLPRHFSLPTRPSPRYLGIHYTIEIESWIVIPLSRTPPQNNAPPTSLHLTSGSCLAFSPHSPHLVVPLPAPSSPHFHLTGRANFHVLDIHRLSSYGYLLSHAPYPSREKYIYVLSTSSHRTGQAGIPHN